MFKKKQQHGFEIEIFCIKNNKCIINTKKELTFKILISLPSRIWDLERFFLLILLMATSQSVFCKYYTKRAIIIRCGGRGGLHGLITLLWILQSIYFLHFEH